MNLITVFIPAPHPTQEGILHETLQSLDSIRDDDFRVVLHKPLYGACDMDAEPRHWLTVSQARGRSAALLEQNPEKDGIVVFLSPGDTVEGEFTFAVRRLRDFHGAEATDGLFPCALSCGEGIKPRGIDSHTFMWATWRPAATIAAETITFERCMAVGWDLVMHNMLLLPTGDVQDSKVRLGENADIRRMWLDVPRRGFGMHMPQMVQQWTPATQMLAQDNIELAPRLIATMVGQPEGEVKRLLTEQGAARDFRTI